MAASYEQAFDALCRHARETAMLSSAANILGWDERTKMPPAGGDYRAEQLGFLAGEVHKRQTDARQGEWLAVLKESPLAADPHSEAGATIREIARDYEKLCKLPQKLVEELARLSTQGQQVWAKARKANDFAAFRPLLAKMVQLKKEQADAIGYDQHRYDALLDDFEPGGTTASIAPVLEALRQELVPLIAEIKECGVKAPVEILHRHFPEAAQKEFGMRAAAAIGFDFEAGRLDETDHPFCSGVAPGDCRITTRYDESFFPSAFFGTLHEAGHGIYEQGLRRDQFGLPPGTSVSLGIHESQSRMWENSVGRGLPFWQFFFPAAQQAFPQALGNVSQDDLYFAVNHVEPSLIRVEADEATYNLHIIIRFELEQALINDDLPVDDLPSAWREKYQQYLGVSSETDANGVMQDVHWSAGLFGYFPTYSLGNVYAAQFFAHADKELGGLEAQFARGEFAPLKTWLNENIHQKGSCVPAAELVKQVTGEPLTHGPLLAYLRGKLAPLYHL